MKSSKNSTNNKSWITTTEEAPDGSGDLLMTLPPDLCEMMNWKEGTVLTYEIKDGVIYMRESVAK